MVKSPRPLEPAGQPLRIQADARSIPLREGSVDLCLTSPPYWKKRDYRRAKQIGRERTATEHVDAIRSVLREVRRVLKPTGSLFLNLGDTYHQRSLAGIPFLIEQAARNDGWRIRNRIVWWKRNGVPTPHSDRLANRHEVILHLAGRGEYFYDVDALCEYQATRFPGGDVWDIPPVQTFGAHPAPFPDELAARVIALACPSQVCRRCGKPRKRIVERRGDLDVNRPQARRALALAEEHGLTDKHFAAIRATGISDAGKARIIQRGTKRNRHEVQRLATEAKRALGGYFREFTFARRTTVGFEGCRCAKGWDPGLVLDVFAGTGTTVRVAGEMGRRAVGLDLMRWGQAKRPKPFKRVAEKDEVEMRAGRVISLTLPPIRRAASR